MSYTVLITGSSRGIGKAIAIRFAQAGCNIVINSINGGEKLNNTLKEITNIQKQFATRCLAFTGNAGDFSFVKEMVEKTISTFGSVDIIINNAGISYVGLIQDMSVDEWQKIMSTNLSSVHFCSQLIVPHMLKSGFGKIINISSVWGNVGASCEVAYSATKGAINSYTKALAKELAPSGIAVNAIACGAVDTDMNKCFTKEDLDALAEEIPYGRMAKPEEIAEVVYHISQCPNYLTGQIITCDGGWT